MLHSVGAHDVGRLQPPVNPLASQLARLKSREKPDWRVCDRAGAERSPGGGDHQIVFAGQAGRAAAHSGDGRV